MSSTTTLTRESSLAASIARTTSRRRYWRGPRPARQRRERARLGRLLDDRAVEVEQQRAVADRLAAAPAVERGEQQPEEQQHRAEHQRVLDADQQLPRAPNQFHGILLASAGRAGLWIAGAVGREQGAVAAPPVQLERAAWTLPSPRPLVAERPRSARGEAAALVRLAGPMVGANLLQMAIAAVDVVFVARLGPIDLAARDVRRVPVQPAALFGDRADRCCRAADRR